MTVDFHVSLQAAGDAPDPDRHGMRRLWAEVLISGLKDASGFVTHPGSNALAEYQAKSWMQSKDFVTVCDLAGIDPSAARSAQEAGKFTREAWAEITRDRSKA